MIMGEKSVMKLCVKYIRNIEKKVSEFRNSRQI